MKLVICIPCSWDRVPRAFFESYCKLEIPNGLEVKTIVRTDVPLDLCRNELATRAIDIEKADYLLWLDCDMTHPPKTIEMLLDCLADVATGVYYRKKYPHYPVVGNYTEWSEQMEPYAKTLEAKGFMEGNRQRLFYKPAVAQCAGQEPFLADVTGMGCVLMRADALKKVEKPWFRYFNGHQDGDHTLGKISEEMTLWSGFKKSGVQLVCTPKVQCGHLLEKQITQADSVMKESQCGVS
jgi:hypothetical protein